MKTISKLLEQHGDRCELHKTQKVGGAVFPTNEEPLFPLKPGEEPLHEPAALVSPQRLTVLGRERAVGAMRSNPIHSVLLERRLELIAVIRTIADEVLRLGLQPGEVEPEWDQRDLMMSGRMRTHGKGEPLPIDNREHLHTCAAFREAHGLTTPFGCSTRRLDEAFAFIKGAFITERQHISQSLAFAPLVKSTMHRLVVGRALREPVPLCAGVQDPQDGLHDGPRGHWFAAGSVFGMCYSGKCSRIRSH